MKIKENIHVFIIIGCIFLVVYIFAAVIPLGKELQLTPKWTINFLEKQNKISELDDKSNTILPFKLGQNFGYFSENGKIVFWESFPFKASISQDYRAPYSQDATNIPFYKAPSFEKQDLAETSIPVGTIQGSGFPFFDKDRIFLFTPGGFGLSEHNPDGSKKWEYEYYVPIITFDSSKAGTALGYTDGCIKVFSQEGKNIHTFFPGGSTYPVILGVALSDSGQQIACVSGIDQQRFVLSQEKKGHRKVVFHKYLEGNQREPVLVQFSENESRVFYSCLQGLGIVDCKTYKHSLVHLKGRILSIQENTDLDIICVLTKDRNEYSVYIIESFGKLIGNFSFEADNAFITVKDNALYIGKNNTISRINMEIK